MTNAAEYPARVREAFPEAKLSVQSFRDRTVLVVEPADLHDILQHLKDHQGFEFLVDVTAVDYDGYPTPQPGRFGVLWILRNFDAEADLVVKTYVDPSLPTDGIEEDPALVLKSSCDLWNAAEWRERGSLRHVRHSLHRPPGLATDLDLERLPRASASEGLPLRGRGEREQYKVVTRDEVL